MQDISWQEEDQKEITQVFPKMRQIIQKEHISWQVQFIQKCPKVGQINPKKGNILWQQGYNSSKNGLRHGRRSHHPKRGCFKSGGPGFVQKGVVSRAEGIVSSENGML